MYKEKAAEPGPPADTWARARVRAEAQKRYAGVYTKQWCMAKSFEGFKVWL